MPYQMLILQYKITREETGHAVITKHHLLKTYVKQMQV